MHILTGMTFPIQLVQLRKARGFTQVELARRAKISKPQLQRYEAGKAQPTLEVIRSLAITLGVSSDALIFDPDERDPDEDLKLQFEAISQFQPAEKEIAKVVLESLILRNDSHRFQQT